MADQIICSLGKVQNIYTKLLKIAEGENVEELVQDLDKPKGEPIWTAFKEAFKRIQKETFEPVLIDVCREMSTQEVLEDAIERGLTRPRLQDRRLVEKYKGPFPTGKEKKPIVVLHLPEIVQAANKGWYPYVSVLQDRYEEERGNWKLYPESSIWPTYCLFFFLKKKTA